MSPDVPPTAGSCTPVHSPPPLIFFGQLQIFMDPKEMPCAVPHDNPPQVTSRPDSVRSKCPPSSKTQRTMSIIINVFVSLTTAQRASAQSFPRVLCSDWISSLFSQHFMSKNDP